MTPFPVHRLWLGPRPMPARFRAYGTAWGKLNPDVRVMDWSWQDLPEDLANGDVMDDLRSRCTRGDSIELATALADVICYDLVARFGGMYVNCDLEPVRSLPGSILAQSGAWAGREDSVHAVNAAFGGPAAHPFWAALVNNLLPVRYWRLREAGEREMNQLTGAHLLSEAMQALPGRLEALPEQMFSPLHFSAIPYGETADGRWDLGSLPPVTVAVHHWDHRRTGRSNIVS